MNKLQVSTLFRNLKGSVSKHSPQILTGIGIAGMITTTVLAVRATPKALELIEAKKELAVEKEKEFTKLDTVKAAWKPYIPAIIAGISSTACLIGACSVSTRRTAAIATAYKVAETALTEYKEKVVETVGEKKVEAIKEKIAKEKVEKNPVSKQDVIITEKGNTLCLDSISGRYFKSDIEAIKKAINTLNRTMTYDMYVSLNDLYYEIGMKPTAIGDDIGWNLDDGLIEIEFGSQIADDGTPCIVLDYNVAPRYDFSELR